jgi:hypothetical protein
LYCKTFKDLCNLLIAGKLKRISDEEQVQTMNVQIQSSGLVTSQIGQKFDFWKQIDDQDLLNWLLGRYHPHTAKCYYSYFNRYVELFFSPFVDMELFKLAKHKRSWILQSIKRFGDFYANRYGNKEVKILIARIIERYDLNRDLDQKDRIYLVSPQFVEEKINKVIKMTGDKLVILVHDLAFKEQSMQSRLRKKYLFLGPPPIQSIYPIWEVFLTRENVEGTGFELLIIASIS